jgi:acetylornithine deacetylase
MPANVIELLKVLVRIPSINPMGRTDIPDSLLYEDRLVDFLDEQFDQRGIDYYRIAIAPRRSNIVATYQPERFVRHILFQSHTDTVPVDGMNSDPFSGVIENGKLHGRGACDVKGGLAAMLAAFLRICEEKPANAAKLTVAFTVDEEHTFLGIKEFVKDQLDIDFAVVAEPTNLNIVTRHKGVARWTTTTAGRACHSSRPQDGESAVYRMAKVLAAVEPYAKQLPGTKRDPFLGSPTLSVGMIQGGVSANTVPDACTIDVDRRLIPGESAEAAFADYEAMLARQHFNFPVRSTLTFACGPLDAIPESNAELLKLRIAINAVHGPHSLEAVPYATDASSLAKAGIPCVVFGPGDIAQAHTHDESIGLAQVEAAADVLYRFAVDA